MIKEQAYSEKFTLLKPWVDQIFSRIKKEVRGDFLRSYPQFDKKHCEKLTNEELKTLFFEEIFNGNEEVGEWATSRWMFRSAEIYQFFAHHLSQVNPNFEEITEIPDAQAASLMRGAIAQFGADSVYIFSILNSVAFSERDYASLREEALKSRPGVEEEKSDARTVEEVEAYYQERLLKLSEKYESRFAGMQKKYLTDLKGYKKQIAELQRRLQNVR